jgi:hypothetical protein
MNTAPGYAISASQGRSQDVEAHASARIPTQLREPL